MKYYKGTEMCEYCEITYHPMTRWTKGDETIFVHSMKFNYDKKTGNLSIDMDDSCEKLAIGNGYAKREDLTPKR